MDILGALDYYFVNSMLNVRCVSYADCGILHEIVKIMLFELLWTWFYRNEMVLVTLQKYSLRSQY